MSQALLDASTVVVKPWWLYRDHQAAAPSFLYDKANAGLALLVVLRGPTLVFGGKSELLKEEGKMSWTRVFLRIALLQLGALGVCACGTADPQGPSDLPESEKTLKTASPLAITANWPALISIKSA